MEQIVIHFNCHDLKQFGQMAEGLTEIWLSDDIEKETDEDGNISYSVSGIMAKEKRDNGC